MTGSQLAKALSWPASKVSRIENGRQRPTAGDVRALAAVCDVTNDEADALIGRLGGFKPNRRPIVTRQRTPYVLVMTQLGFVRLPDGGWACADSTARALVEVFQEYEEQLRNLGLKP